MEEALWRAARGKRSRRDVAEFLLGQEEHLVELRRELRSGVYQPGPYRSFVIREPKQRQISAAPFRDRVVHHALTQILEPIFEQRFVDASYACRIGKGTHRALDAVRKGARHCGFVLRGDIRKYFASIDHEILAGKLARVIRCRPTLDLAGRIVAGSNIQEPANWYFPGDDLFSPAMRRRGLPLGNQTSQFFANVYLNAFDHRVWREIRPRVYARYVDDFVLLDNDRGKLEAARYLCEEWLQAERLRLHEAKTQVIGVGQGFPFLGWTVYPNRCRLAHGNVVRFRRRLRRMEREYAAGHMEWNAVRQGVASWVGHAQHGDTWRLREQIFAQHDFCRTGEHKG